MMADKRDAVINVPGPEVDPDVQLVRDLRRSAMAIFAAFERWAVARKAARKETESRVR
jgi:hypothetical protein